MIQFSNISDEEPYKKLYSYYNEALKLKQKNIQILSISSFNNIKNEVDSRYVNLKIVNKKKFIFFTNYKSPKSIQFKAHDQVSALLFWDSLNLQIRMQARIKKTSKEYNDEYFLNRSVSKNALAISSLQSSKIDCYEDVIKKYEKTKKNKNLKKCPNYWGGFQFIPYKFEFWEGHRDRLNKRLLYEYDGNVWNEFFLEP